MAEPIIQILILPITLRALRADKTLSGRIVPASDDDVSGYSALKERND